MPVSVRMFHILISNFCIFQTKKAAPVKPGLLLNIILRVIYSAVFLLLVQLAFQLDSSCSFCFLSYHQRVGFFLPASFASPFLSIDFIEIHQFNHGCFCIITRSCAQFDDPGITTRTACYFFSNSSKQFSDRFFILQIAEYHPALMCCIFLWLW